MSHTEAEPHVLCPESWGMLERAHQGRADVLTAGHRARHEGSAEPHAIEDFLFTYYNTRPATLRRWHPGVGVHLEWNPDTRPKPAKKNATPPREQWRWYRVRQIDGSTTLGLDLEAYLAERRESVEFIHSFLQGVASRPAFTGCFGLHEWAMVYRQSAHRHPLPLRLGQSGTDAVVEGMQIRCSHFDAFRFFTPAAEPLNSLQPTRATQRELDQPGCLHVGMDLHKWAMKLGPIVPGELALDCFELARDIRVLDMQASPYDVSELGYSAVAIETPAGRAEYVRQQKIFSDRAGALRRRLIDVIHRTGIK